jgi:hypothetical protein
MNVVDRPSFSEGQLLSAADLQLGVDYAREQLETHQSTAHTAGIVEGMTIVLRAASAGGGAQDAFVSAGYAVDTAGSQIAVTSTTPIVATPLAGSPTGEYPVFAWVADVPLAAGVPANPCATADNDRVEEQSNVAVVTDASEAEPNAIQIGSVWWDATLAAFKAFPSNSGAASDGRQGAGVRAHEIVAAEGTVLVHAANGSPATLAVEARVNVVASGDGTAPAVRIAGGTLQLCATDSAAATQTVTLGYVAPTATSNALVVDVGNTDPASALLVQTSAGDVLAAVSGAASAETCSGTVTAGSGDFQNVTASASVAAGSGGAVVTLGAVPPTNDAGIAAANDLALAFGASKTATFYAGTTPAVAIDASALTVSEKQLTVGVIDATSNAVGMAVRTGDALQLRTAHGDIVLNPGAAALGFLRFGADATVYNLAKSCDVTPSTSTGARASVLRLGPLAIAFGTESLNDVEPLTAAKSNVTFSPAFSAAPAFFVTAYRSGGFTVGAAAVDVSSTSASYQIVHLHPDAPTDGDDATWSNAKIDVTVSWIALGTVS